LSLAKALKNKLENLLSALRNCVQVFRSDWVTSTQGDAARRALLHA